MASDSSKSRLALAHRRKDVHALNQAIRSALRDENQAKEDVLLQTETGKRAFGKGDRIVFTRNDKELGVKNGMLGTVRKASEGKIRVQVDGSDHKDLSFDPGTYRSFDHGYAVTIHKSQGVTVDQAYVLRSRSLDSHLNYVAMTRHKSELAVFQSGEDRPEWVNAAVQQRNRVTAPRRSGPSMG
ncbi:MAG: hypothetical protein AAGL96_18635 [Pseudomonadota bacterium]